MITAITDLFGIKPGNVHKPDQGKTASEVYAFKSL